MIGIHLLVTYPGSSADMNQTRIFWDGQLVDVPASSSDGTVATVSGIDLRLGSSHDGMTHMSGDLDGARCDMPKVRHGLPMNTKISVQAGVVIL